MDNAREFSFGSIPDIETLKKELNLRVEESFGLNSMHMAIVRSRSEAPYRSHHVTLKVMLEKTQKDYSFSKIKGSLVCVYYPDYMDGINAPGWHLHFISEDRSLGGHVFGLQMKDCTVRLKKISLIEIKIPNDPTFDTYSLKKASKEEIKQVEQGQ